MRTIIVVDEEDGKVRCEDQPLNKAVDKEGREIRRGASDQRKRSHDAARTYHEPCCWSEPDYEGVKASGNDPVRKLWATEGELASSRESLLAIGGMRAGTRL